MTSAALIAISVAAAALPSPPQSDLSIMTYNIHGLPWPIAQGRPKALKAIAEHLASMRAQGSEPHLVLLQEAFTGDAKAIGREAGYPYVISGPDRHSRGEAKPDAQQARFASAARRTKGEGDGTLEDSGLEILSDYPVLSVRRMSYPRFACAGFDCLANKGILLVEVSIPGASEPLAVVETHMNSRGASGVRRSRADLAFAWQAAQLREFISANVPPSAAAVVAGDLNIGRAAYRQAIISDTNPLLAGGDDALRSALAGRAPIFDMADAQKIAQEGKDWMFVRSGSTTKLSLDRVAVAFGRNSSGKSLSDHLGYVSYYAVQDAKR